jgi:hypothetical protein
MRLRNILKLAFQTCEAFQNVTVILHPVQRFQNLSLIAIHLGFKRLELSVDNFKVTIHFAFESLELLVDQLKSLVNQIEPLIEFGIKLVDFGIERLNPLFDRPVSLASSDRISGVTKSWIS